jgi:xanthine phosphoribosyltransferase
VFGYVVTEKAFLSWDQIHSAARGIYESLREAFAPTEILAITRGGLIPAGLFAYFFDVKKVSVVGMERIGTEDGGRYVHRLNDFPAYSEEQQETLLIVDDVADTGITAGVVRQFYPRATIVTLSAKPAGRDKVDRYSILVPQDTWIVFPWAVSPDPD